MSDVLRKKILVGDADPIVAVITSHILTRDGFAVDTVHCTCGLRKRLETDRYHAIVLSDAFATELASALDPARVVLLGDSIPPFKPFVRLRKPVELDLVSTTVRACANQ